MDYSKIQRLEFTQKVKTMEESRLANGAKSAIIQFVDGNTMETITYPNVKASFHKFSCSIKINEDRTVLMLKEDIPDCIPANRYFKISPNG